MGGRIALGLVIALAAPALAGCLGIDTELLSRLAPAADPWGGPKVVIAHIDTGINPYHRAFRDESPLAYAHPSTYLPGYPADAPSLNLSLNATSFEAAFRADASIWASVEHATLYWIPGTRIVGAISFVRQPSDPTDPTDVSPLVYDYHGHGTMTASRMAAGNHSLCPECRIVSIQGLSGAGVRWAAEQGWIDVQTNSWGSLVPYPGAEAFSEISPAFQFASSRMVTLAASGNGAGFFMGFTPNPSHASSTMPAGVIAVGAHDNGRITLWHGQPAHVIADGYGGWRAERASLDAFGPSGESCCTSAASPYAAGGAAALLLEARRVLGDARTGLEGDALAVGAPDRVPSGPLADGKLTLAEFRAVFLATATSRPREGPDDGLAHWAGNGTTPDPADPAGNPYCVGCWTTPAAWENVPGGAPLYANVGYGAIDPASLALAIEVLAGTSPLPSRPSEDAFFALDQAARGAIQGSEAFSSERALQRA